MKPGTIQSSSSPLDRYSRAELDRLNSLPQELLTAGDLQRKKQLNKLFATPSYRPLPRTVRFRLMKESSNVLIFRKRGELTMAFQTLEQRQANARRNEAREKDRIAKLTNAEAVLRNATDPENPMANKSVVKVSSAAFAAIGAPEPELPPMLLCPVITHRFNTSDLRAIRSRDSELYMSLAKLADTYHEIEFNARMMGYSKEYSRTLAEENVYSYALVNRASQLLISAGVKKAPTSLNSWNIKPSETKEEAKQVDLKNPWNINQE